MIFLLTIVSGILCAVGIIGWQYINFLMHGEWHSLSVISALQWFGIRWSYFPTEWLGLYKILDFFPLSLATFILGGVLAYFFQKLRNNL